MSCPARLLPLALLAVLLLAWSSAATAGAAARNPWGYYLSKSYAERFAVRAASQAYSDYLTGSRMVSLCRPQGRSRAQRGYWYHRWICAWAGEEYWSADDYPGYDTFCYGRLKIVGSSGSSFYWRVINGIRCGNPY